MPGSGGVRGGDRHLVDTLLEQPRSLLDVVHGVHVEAEVLEGLLQVARRRARRARRARRSWLACGALAAGEGGRARRAGGGS